MNENKMFSKSFRMNTFEEIKSTGNDVSHNLIGIVQNPVPMTVDDLQYFNSHVDACIERLNAIKKSVNDEFYSDRLVPFSE